MAKYTIDAVLEVWGSFDVEADSFGEAYRKAAENPGKYANLKVWNDGAEAQLRTYNRINCVGEYDIDDAVAALTGKDVKKERTSVFELLGSPLLGATAIFRTLP